MTTPKKLAIVLITVILLFATFVSWKNFWWKYPMSDLDMHLRTACVGAYQFKIPEAFTVEFDEANINGVDIRAIGDMGQEELQALIQDRIRALKDGIYSERSGETLTLVSTPDSEYKNIRVIAYRNSYAPEGLINLEAYLHLDGRVFMLERQLVGSTDLRPIEQISTRLAMNDKGFCLDGLSYEGAIDSAVASVILKDPEVKGYSITVQDYSGLHAPAKLPAEKNSSPKARPREVAGLPGFETRVVSSAHEADNQNAPVIRFLVRAGNAAEKNAAFAQIRVSLSKDAPSADTAPYTPQLSAQIWETLLSSIKRRKQ